MNTPNHLTKKALFYPIKTNKSIKKNFDALISLSHLGQNNFDENISVNNLTEKDFDGNINVNNLIEKDFDENISHRWRGYLSPIKSGQAVYK